MAAERLNSEEVTVIHTRFICSSCKNEMKKPTKGCQFCGGKEYVQLVDRDNEQEREVQAIINQMKNEFDRLERGNE